MPVGLNDLKRMYDFLLMHFTLGTRGEGRQGWGGGGVGTGEGRGFGGGGERDAGSRHR